MMTFSNSNIFSGSRKSQIISQENEALTREINQLKREINQIENKTLINLKNNKKSLEDDVKGLTNQINNYQQEIRLAEEEITKKTKENQESESQITSEFNNKLELDKVSLASVKELNKGLQLDLANLKNSLDNLKGEIEKYLKENNINEVAN
tara:strand:+ start:225 stop:680 length:456 start_codon:yes stop_codon:yes gene_type:complete